MLLTGRGEEGEPIAPSSLPVPAAPAHPLHHTPAHPSRCQVVPAILKLFASNDRGIRRSLLENIGSYGPAMPNNLVEEQVGVGGVCSVWLVWVCLCG